MNEDNDTNMHPEGSESWHLVQDDESIYDAVSRLLQIDKEILSQGRRLAIVTYDYNVYISARIHMEQGTGYLRHVADFYINPRTNQTFVAVYGTGSIP